MVNSSTDWPSLVVSLTALCVSLIALVFAREQLVEARTANGGRAMRLHISLAKRDDLSEEDAARVDAAIAGLNFEFVPFLISYEVTGPAVFYQVLPYSWGEDGVSQPAGNEVAIPRLSCEDGPCDTVAMIQKELVEEIRIGVVWMQPSGEGMRSGAIRFDHDGVLEEWVWRNRLIGKLPFVQPGIWKRRRDPNSSVGPLTQPWQLKR